MLVGGASGQHGISLGWSNSPSIMIPGGPAPALFDRIEQSRPGLGLWTNDTPGVWSSPRGTDPSSSTFRPYISGVSGFYPPSESSPSGGGLSDLDSPPEISRIPGQGGCKVSARTCNSFARAVATKVVRQAPPLQVVMSSPLKRQPPHPKRLPKSSSPKRQSTANSRRQITPKHDEKEENENLGRRKPVPNQRQLPIHDDEEEIDKRANQRKNTIFVKGFRYQVSKDDLQGFFARCGAISSIALPRSRKTGRSRRIAWVTFETPEATTKALRLDGAMLMNKNLRICIAQYKPNGSAAESGNKSKIEKSSEPSHPSRGSQTSEPSHHPRRGRPKVPRRGRGSRNPRPPKSGVNNRNSTTGRSFKDCRADK